MAFTRTPAEAFSVKVALMVIILVVIVLNAGGFLIYRTSARNLDIEWGRRLESLASVVALQVGERIRSGDAEEEDIYDSLEPWLEQVRNATLLRSIFILADPEGGDFIATGTDENQLDILQRIDFFEISGAWEGVVNDSEFYKVGDSYYKRAYAPVFDAQGIDPVLVVGVEADASFFVVLERIRRRLWVVAAISFLLCFLFVPVVFRMTESFVHLEDALARSEKSLQLDQLASSLAHEIRNPLGIVQANAEVLLNSTDDEGQVEMLRDILEETERLDHLVTGALGKLSQTESERQHFDIREALKQATEHFRRTLDKRNIRLEIHLPPEETALPIEGDQARFEGAIWNLLRNAQEAISGDGLISVGLEIPEYEYRVSVSDTGRGIARWRFSKIFLPFYSEKREGTGLGLPTVQRLVKEMAGSVSFRSAKGKGTRVSIIFPRKTVDSAEIEQP